MIRNCKRLLAIACCIALMLVVTACSGGNNAPTSYDLTAAGVSLDPFDKVVGDRNFVSISQTGEGDHVTAITVTYSGIADAMADISKYGLYLYALGYTDYYGTSDARLNVVKREGDGGVFVTIRYDDPNLQLNIYYSPEVALQFTDNKYVPGDTMAFMPNPEVIIFTYPVLIEDHDTTDRVNQLILDGMNEVIQYVKEDANGRDFELIGGYSIESALPGKTTITYTAEYTVDDVSQALSFRADIFDLLTEPMVEFGDVEIVEAVG